MPSRRLGPEDLANFDHLIPDFTTVITDLEDARVRGRTAHSLTPILFVSVSAAMAGVKSCVPTATSPGFLGGDPVVSRTWDRGGPRSARSR